MRAFYHACCYLNYCYVSLTVIGGAPYHPRFGELSDPNSVCFCTSWCQIFNATDLWIEYPYGNTKEVSLVAVF